MTLADEDPVTLSAVVMAPVEDELREAPSLDEEQVRRLAELGKRIERHRGAPQDIEWAVDAAGALHVLQVRPETTWSTRAKTSITKGSASGMDRVLAKFGAAKK